ncbi:MAG: DUF1847 domain-containing protein [Alphaproteobacteria bacterium]
MAAYEDPGCAYCPDGVRACRVGEQERRGPGFCPSKVNGTAVRESLDRYQDDFTRRVIQESTVANLEGYTTYTRVEGICAFAKRMNFTKIGIASCISFLDSARTLSEILESHGFKVASACCRNGGIDGEALGISKVRKTPSGTPETVCNPIGQAELLNQAGCELNVILGLCVGHDSLFARASQGLTTTLVVKDRILAHNPIGALTYADTLYQRVWGPERPQKPTRKPRVIG